MQGGSCYGIVVKHRMQSHNSLTPLKLPQKVQEKADIPLDIKILTIQQIIKGTFHLLISLVAF